MEQSEKHSGFFLRARNLGDNISLNFLPNRSKSRSNSLADSEVNSTGVLRDEGNKRKKSVDFTGVTPHQLARDGNVQMMEKFLDRFTNPQLRKKKVNARDDEKLTPLHYAARFNHYDMMAVLLNNGAGVQAKEEDGATPLHFIARYKKKSLKLAKENEESDDEGTSTDECLRCIKLLVDHRADVNDRDSLGLTPLHHACIKKNTIVVRELLSYPGIKIEKTDLQGLTALHVSCVNGLTKIVKMLLNAGANLRCRDKALTTPFHFSCIEGNLEIVNMLLHKADEIKASAHKEMSFVTVVDESIKAKTKSGDANGKNGKHSDLPKSNVETTKSSKSIPRNRSTESLKNKLDFVVKNDAALHALLANPNRGAIDLLQDTDADKNLPFHLAIENGQLDVVKLCIERSQKAGWNNMVHACRSHEDSALHLAVQSNSLDIVKLLIDEKVNVNARNSSLATPLLLSCQHNSHEIVNYLLQNGANVELTDSDNLTPLMIACRYGHVETIMHLLEYGADVTSTDKDEKTCLMWAAEENQADAISLLLEKDELVALIGEKNKHNNTALHLASMKGHNDVAKLLLEHRAAADLKNDDDRTTLHMAALYGHDVLIPVLVNKDHSIINTGDEESNTALHLAAIAGNLKCVSSLLQSGVNLELRNTRQWTPLDCAAASGWEKIVKLLLESGANIQPKSKTKKSTNKVAPILLACQRGHVDVVKILLEWKADVTYRSSDGRNALDFAIDFGQRDCVLALIKHETWQKSLKNAVIHPVSGRMISPMRKLIMKMEDMAMVVCNQCLSDNGKKPEHDEYAVTFSYELLDDMYSSTEWLATSGNAKDSKVGDDDDQYDVYDDNDNVTKEANTYTTNASELQANHPLHVMVTSQSETLLLHPLVTALLNHKWKRYGRYVYYSNLILFLFYMILLNAYMLILPLTYQLDWVKMFDFRRYLSQNRSTEGIGLSIGDTLQFQNASSACLFFRQDVIEDISAEYVSDDCHTIKQSELSLRWVVFLFSIFNLCRSVIQFLGQMRSFFTLRNILEVVLYVLSLLVTIQFSSFSLNNIRQLTGGRLLEDNTQQLSDLQFDTGLRQEWQEQAGAFAVFLSWMNLLLYIQMIPKIGIFVVMFTDILKTFAEFFIVFALFIFAFALSFHILLGNQHEFERWYESLVKTTVMTIGELDYGTIFFSASESVSDIGSDYAAEVFARPITLILFSIFLISMTIIIMNLTVGLAVGDIIEIQKNATLQSLGMQVDLTLQVEFTLPTFLRKKFFLRKQIIELNKYRSANFVKRFLFENSNLQLEEIAKAVDEEEAEQEESKTAEDKVLIGLNLLRGRISDVISEQGGLKDDVRGVRALVRETKMESRQHADVIKENINDTSADLSGKIDFTRSGLKETTSLESDQTRDRVQGTLMVMNQIKDEMVQEINQVKKSIDTTTEEMVQEINHVKKSIDKTTDEMVQEINQVKKSIDITTINLSNQIESTHSGLNDTTLNQSSQTRERVDQTVLLVNVIKEDLANTKQEIAAVKSDLEKRIDDLQEEMVSKKWKELKDDVTQCHEEVAKTKYVIVELLQELKLTLVKERYMSKV